MTRRLRSRLSAAVLCGSMLVPLPAFALESLLSIAESKLAKILQDAEETLAKNAATITSTYNQLLGKKGGAESILAAGEKVTAGKKELTQAKINYQAAVDANERYMRAQDTYLSPSAQAFQSCEGLAAEQRGTASLANTDVSAKAMSRALVKDQLFVNSEAAIVRDRMGRYRELYCSEADVERGRCTNSAPKAMQGAAIDAGTLLIPSAGETYGVDEARAAADFVTMVTNPSPSEMLPRALESGRGGERFQIAQMVGQSRMSVATGALVQIMASRMPLDTNGGLSLVASMKAAVEMRNGNPRYAESLQRQGERPLYEEINHNLASMNWMEFHAFNQNSRIESIIATQLAVSARDSASRELAIRRAQVKSTR